MELATAGRLFRVSISIFKFILPEQGRPVIF